MTLLSRFSVRIGRPALAVSLVAFLPGACGQAREAARLAALEAGLASAQAGLSALSATSAASPVAPGPAADLTPYRPVAAATTAAARTAAAARLGLNLRQMRYRMMRLGITAPSDDAGDDAG